VSKFRSRFLLKKKGEYMELNDIAIRQDIQKWMRTYAEAYCKQAAKDITRMASQAIDRFYQEYTPKYYNRTEDLLNNSYSPYYHDNGKAIYGGVRISSANMQPYKGAGISEYEIATSAWKKGIHGFEERDKSNLILTRSPIAMVLREMKNKHFLNSLNKVGSNAAKKQTYSSFKF
jgi:hypothetical protein